MIKQIRDVEVLGTLSNEWIDSLQQRVEGLTGWNSNRSVAFEVHRATSSIEVAKSPLSPDFHNKIEAGAAYDVFERDVNSLSRLLREQMRFVDPKVVRFLLVNLPAGARVEPHRDFGPGLMIGARIHLPIVTNDKVRFSVGDACESLKRGTLYEINNSRRHSVDNQSDQDRIHCIFDICDMWHIEDQIKYAIASSRDDPNAPNIQNAFGEVPPELHFCSGRVQERLSQDRQPIHLFILCPNNAGSTLITQYLARCKQVATLPREGQFMRCFQGPNPIQLNVRHVFTEDEKSFRDPTNYDWDTIKKGWYRHWRMQSGKTVFLEKSPPNILRADLLKLHFPNVRFILQVRNPYATAEGIARRTESRDFRKIGRHVFRVLRVQLENAKKFQGCSTAVRYEDICENPRFVTERLATFLPEIDDLDFSKVIQIKDYQQPISNLNDEQISRLTRSDLDQINESFDQEAMDRLNYTKL